MSLRVGVLTVSDGCARGEREDLSGRILAGALPADTYTVTERAVVPDDAAAISRELLAWCAACDLILTTGGTGFAPRDVTPEATRAVIEREAPGLAEMLRWTGYQKLDRAVLSRGVAGIRGRTLLINLPGSPGGVRDGLAVLLPLLPHAVAILQDRPVDHSPSPSRAEPAPEPSSSKAGAILPDPEAERIRQTLPPAAVVVMECNLDDFSPEYYETLIDSLFAGGALDVFLTPIQMKKGRPGTLLTALAPPDTRDELAEILFRESSTFGIRFTTMERLTLERQWEVVTTVFGPIRIKVGLRRGQEVSAAPEYEDVKAAALRHGVPVKVVAMAAQRARL